MAQPATQRTTYRAKQASVCACGKLIQVGQPIQYVPNDQWALDTAPRGRAWNARRSNAAHRWCAENWTKRTEEV